MQALIDGVVVARALAFYRRHQRRVVGVALGIALVTFSWTTLIASSPLLFGTQPSPCRFAARVPVSWFGGNPGPMVLQRGDVVDVSDRPTPGDSRLLIQDAEVVTADSTSVWLKLTSRERRLLARAVDPYVFTHAHRRHGRVVHLECEAGAKETIDCLLP